MENQNKELDLAGLNIANKPHENMVNQKKNQHGMRITSHIKSPKSKKLKILMYLALATIAIIGSLFAKLESDAKDILMSNRGAERIETKDGYSYIIEYKLPEGVEEPTSEEIIGQIFKNVGDRISGIGEDIIESDQSLNRG
jgi:hypothetical protein